jgi:CNT family concentrative nucleoside transporter
VPETEQPATMGSVKFEAPPQGANLIEAAAIGAADGVKLAINVAAMLIAFIALLAMLDAAVLGVGWCVAEVTATEFPREWTLSGLLGYLFAPMAWMMGIETKDCLRAGELLGKDVCE